MEQNKPIEEEILARKALEAELERTQKSLLQSEKMASLGVLSAGVAHEINNPVGYILSNITTLNEYIPQITESFDALQALLADITPDNPLYEKALQAEKCLKKNELNYLLEDTSELVEETREGAIRVLDIVKGLKNYAHAEDSEMQEADINKCLLSTLSLVNNELKYHCKIETSLGDLPRVHCSISKLGQVFMNLMVNAGHAIDSNGVISISSEVAGDDVVVCFSDNGCGMSEDIMKSIFDPFFTTKAKGLGTGLGLAISAGIIEEHGGRIEVDSVIDEGTTFTISLPIAGVDQSAQ